MNTTSIELNSTDLVEELVFVEDVSLEYVGGGTIVNSF